MESAVVQNCFDPQQTERQDPPGFIFRHLRKGRRELLFWILQTLFWSSIGVIGLLMTMAFKAAVQDVGWVIFMRMAIGFVETAGLRWIYRQPLFLANGLAKWPAAVACCVALAVTEIVIMKALAVAGISVPGGAETVGARLVAVRLFILAIWSSLYFAIHLLEKAHAMELRATKAELAARENELRHLQAQMNPHFFLNSLSTVLACKNDAEAVKEVTQSISDYLRFLFNEARPLEPLSRELDAIEKYLSVQAAHFGGKLICRIQAEKAARAVMVPPMVVQPMLEDAFLHRGDIHEAALQIWVTARIEKKFLLVTVTNTGVQVSPAVQQLPDGGLRALHQRLRLLLGEGARVEQESDANWKRVTIHAPLAAS
ncbi:MAG: histidine kinase [Luteolibacter sp.]|uniref:sensor histidine kinase n=1 Tax=Luteolibacter sp. TaxID=1962973 RepID=UPI003267F5E3